jgi:hypothetical protein
MRGERRVDGVSKSCLFLRILVSKRSRKLSTKELVRMQASGVPEEVTES